MSEKTEKYQAYVDSLVVARMSHEFTVEFIDTYDAHVSLKGVGPLQSFLGWAVSQGYIDVKLNRVTPLKKHKNLWQRLVEAFANREVY